MKQSKLLVLVLALLVVLTACPSTAQNQAPTAVLTATPTAGTTPLLVTFDATESTDDNAIVKYVFNFGDDSPTEENTTGQATHTYNFAGSYNATVTVFDADNANVMETVAIQVSAVEPMVCRGDFIVDSEDTENDIAQVQGCTEIHGSLEIKNTNLENLSFLSNLTKVVYWFSIRGNDALHDLYGLNNLSYADYLSITGNDRLINLNGLNNLTSVGSLDIDSNDSLTSFNGLESLSLVNSRFRIEYNHALPNLDGLHHLVYVAYFDIVDNDVLASLNGLDSLASVENLEIIDNDALPNLRGLENISSLGGFTIKDNSQFTSLHGLDGLWEVSGTRKIYGNSAFDCSSYNQSPPPYFPLTKSEGNQVDCITE